MDLFCAYCKSMFENTSTLKNHWKREPLHNKKKQYLMQENSLFVPKISVNFAIPRKK